MVEKQVGLVHPPQLWACAVVRSMGSLGNLGTHQCRGGGEMSLTAGVQRREQRGKHWLHSRGFGLLASAVERKTVWLVQRNCLAVADDLEAHNKLLGCGSSYSF